ncbi:MAG: C25 family cysteine peptidase [Candidatus Zixiibacteriota bacterium]
MRKSLVCLFFLVNLFVFLGFCLQIQAKTTHLSLSFTMDDLRIEKARDFDRVFLKNTDILGKSGEPMLPAKLIRIIIPVEQRIASVRIVSKKLQTIPGNYKIYPIQPELPLSQIVGKDGKIDFILPDPRIYGSNSEFPGESAKVLSYGFMAGHHIATLAIYPLQYIPNQGKLTFISNLELELIYQPSERRPLSFSHRSRRAKQIYSRAVKSMVINPDDVDLTQQRLLSPTQETEVEYVIITTSGFAASFQPLADWKTKKGVLAEVYTVEWITANYSGGDTQEQIRNFIRDMYQNHGTIWVLLGGDVDYVPHRIAWAFYNEGGWNDEIPADYYYSDLDSNWNADGDTIYGEWEDEVDMYPDVFVGRVPANNPSQVFYFINKTLEYEVTPPADYMLNILLTGEVLWASPYTPGGVLKDYIDSAYIPDRFDSTITKLYQSLGNLNLNSFRDAFNSGQNIINHYGHGNVTGFGIGLDSWNTGNMSALTNAPHHSILYTISCLSNAFDFSDCLGESFIKNTNGGGVAYIGNSRYGWGSPGNPTEGSGPKLDRRFFEELFVNQSYHVGQTLSYAKAYYASSAQSNQYLRWTLYALNLLGDPELPVWTDIPGQPEVSYPEKILTGMQNLEVLVENEGTPVEQALVCLNNNLDLYLRETTSEQGIATFNFEVPDTGEIHIVVTAKDCLPHQDTILVLNYFPGDANGDTEVTIADVVFIINYLFNSGEAPDPVERGDADCDGEVKIADAVYLINYLFKGGSEPCS